MENGGTEGAPRGDGPSLKIKEKKDKVHCTTRTTSTSTACTYLGTAVWSHTLAYGRAKYLQCRFGHIVQVYSCTKLQLIHP